MEHLIYVLTIQIQQKKKTEFVDSIIKDVEWLGAHYDGEVKFASDYFSSNV